MHGYQGGSGRRRGSTGRGAREKAAAAEEEAADPELTGLDSESEADTPDGTVSGTGE